MTRPELTYEEFSELPMQYHMGMTFETGAQRLYRNDEHGVQKEVYTKRNPRTCEWGKSTTAFFLDGDERQFANSAECYVAYMERACGNKENT